MTQTAWVLSLTQFYLSLGFLIFFLALELGLAWVLFFLRLRVGRTDAAMLAYRFWVRVYALTLIIGFAASLPLLLQLGSLWQGLMDRAGEIIGPLIAMAVLTTFIFKSCFLGAMLYGQRSLSNGMHALVVGMVALGTSLTAWWVVALLAWMQWPVGAALVEQRYQVRSWLAALDGAAPTLFGILLTGGLLLAATLMLSITAQRTRARPSDAGDRSVYLGALVVLLLALVVQVGLAARLGDQLLPVQPARLAAVLPQWDSGPPSPLTILAWPDSTVGRNTWAWLGASPSAAWLPPAVAPDAPQAASGAVVQGLADLVGMRPPVLFTYLSARLALGLLALLGLMGAWGLWRAWRLGFEPDKLSRCGRAGLQAMAWLGVLGQLVGWGHLMVGSLPYAVYGTVTLREIGTVQGEAGLWWTLGLQLLVYGALALGFRQLLGHTLRYGVVPVARHRGRA